MDKDRLQKLGYTSVLQCSVQSKRADATNSQIMEYLKGVVPKMFQVINTFNFRRGLLKVSRVYFKGRVLGELSYKVSLIIR